MSPGGYRVPPRVAWCDSTDALVVYVMQVPDGEPLVLHGTAALIYLVALETSDVVDTVAEIVGEAPEVISADVERSLDTFVRQGLLVVADG